MMHENDDEEDEEGWGIHFGDLSRQPVNPSVNMGDFGDCSRQASRQKT